MKIWKIVHMNIFDVKHYVQYTHHIHTYYIVRHWCKPNKINIPNIFHLYLFKYHSKWNNFFSIFTYNQPIDFTLSIIFGSARAKEHSVLYSCFFYLILYFFALCRVSTFKLLYLSCYWAHISKSVTHNWNLLSLISHHILYRYRYFT